MKFARDGQAWIDANDCGLGLQDLLVILYFAISPEFEVVLVEEPESHVHPDMQRRLLAFLKDGTSKQFFISTHSSVFTNTALVDRVYLTSFNGSVELGEATSQAVILNNLGYSVAENLVSDLIILTEGPTDIPVIEEFLSKMNLYTAYAIKIWPLGGDIMDQLDLSVLAERSTVMALVDNDPGSAQVRGRFARNCRAANVPVHRLSAYALENYFSVRALREVFGVQIPAGLARLAPDQKVETQIGLNPKKNNRNIAAAMTLDEIRGTDLFAFLDKVRKVCTQGTAALRRRATA